MTGDELLGRRLATAPVAAVLEIRGRRLPLLASEVNLLRRALLLVAEQPEILVGEMETDARRNLPARLVAQVRETALGLAAWLEGRPLVCRAAIAAWRYSHGASCGSIVSKVTEHECSARAAQVGGVTP